MSLLQNPSQKFCWQGNNNNANEVSAVEESLYTTEEVMYRLGGAGDPLLLQRRARMMDTYTQLQQTHPALPSNLRDFQVQPGTCLMPY